MEPPAADLPGLRDLPDLLDGARVVPVLRSFDRGRAEEFYLGYLGFALDWEHRFEPDLPLYCQVSRGSVRLHLSEHHGDGSPGAAVLLEVDDVEALHASLDPAYGFARPGLATQPWGRTFSVRDPFHNALTFLQPGG